MQIKSEAVPGLGLGEMMSGDASFLNELKHIIETPNKQ
jgi:hypothetical protein